MKLVTRWNDKMIFTASADSHSVQMDTKSPLGTDSALTPKQLVVAGLCGCTAMDVVALMKKHKQPVESFEVEADVEKSTTGHPEVFTRATLTFKFKGQIEAARALESVNLSQTRYCGVSAMLSKVMPIEYIVIVNDQEVGRGHAKF